jgi:hypothetical protein
MDGAFQIAVQSVLVAGWTLYVLALLLRRSAIETEV